MSHADMGVNSFVGERWNEGVAFKSGSLQKFVIMPLYSHCSPCSDFSISLSKIPIWKIVWVQNSSQVGTAQPHSLCKYRSHAKTYIRLFSIYGYQEHIPNSSGKIKCQRSAFAFRNPARAMAAALTRQDDVWITTKQLVRFHKIEFDEMLCKLDSSEYARSFEQTKPCLKFKFKNERRQRAAVTVRDNSCSQMIGWVFNTQERKKESVATLGALLRLVERARESCEK